MPALIGYLLAISVFLGAGYAGLEWLASPDEPVVAQHTKVAAPVVRKHAEPKPSVPLGDSAVKADQVDPGSTTAIASSDHPDTQAADTGAGKAMTQGPDAVPPGGCTPIGLTASGQMVFPFECRGFLAAQRDAPVSAPSEHKASVQNSDVAPGAKQPEETGSIAGVEPPRGEEPSTNGAPAPASAAVQHESASGITPTTTVPSPKEPVQAASDKGSPAESAKPVRRSLAETRAQKPEKPRTTDRSKLVRMTLLTIEFPDGHREQRLVPYRRPPRSFSADDEY